MSEKMEEDLEASEEQKKADPPIVIAEIGINHNGSMETAKEMIIAARDAGANLIKLQSIRPEHFMQSSLPYYKDMERLSLSLEQNVELFEFAKQNRANLFSTVFDIGVADLLEKLHTPAYKIASMDCNNTPLLRHLGKKKIPIFLSTGMATMQEIEKAIETIRKEGNEQIILFYCVSDYPAEVGTIDLNVMTSFWEKFMLPYGFSDHSIGINASIAAAVAGAVAIEKHFTLDRKQAEQFPFSDHAISIEPAELKALVDFCQDVPNLMGSGKKKLTENEEKSRQTSRRGLYAASDIAEGEELCQNNIAILRPEGNTPVDRWDDINGTKAKCNIKKGEQIPL